MGFRRPVKTVASLDTGQGFARGSVESYTDNPTGPLGTPLHTAAGFHFRDGISGDTPAALVNVAYYAAQGGNALTMQGGGLFLASGSYNGVQGPELDLNVESAAAGGYRPVARVSQPFEPLATAFPSWAAGWRDYPSSSFERPRFTQQADGSVLFAGLLQNNSGATKGAVGTGVSIGTIPAAYRPLQLIIGQAIGQGGIVVRLDLQPDGQIVYNDSPGLVSAGYLSVRTNYRLDTTPSA